MSNFLQLLCS